MKTLEGHSYQRLMKIRKSQIYKQMLDQQIRNKNQTMKQKDKKYLERRYSTEPGYNKLQAGNLGGFSQYTTIQKLPSINFLSNINSRHLKQQKLLHIKKPKHFTYPNPNLESQDETQQYLRQCQDIIRNLKLITNKNVQKSSHKQNNQIHFNRKKQGEKQILRVSIPKENPQFKENNNFKKHKNPNSSRTLSNQKTLKKNNDKNKDGINKLNNHNYSFAQFQDNNQFSSSRHTTDNINNIDKVNYDTERKNSSQRSNKFQKSSQTIQKGSFDNKIYSNDSNKYRNNSNQQRNNSSFKNRNQENKQKTNFNKFLNDIQQNKMINSQELAQKNKTHIKNTTILKHLMNVRQRGSLLFKKIKQFKQQRQSLKRQKHKGQQQQFLHNLNQQY